MPTPLDFIDPTLDLVLDRTIPVPRPLVWSAWTKPDLLMKWFTPAPWRTVACELDLRPGGRFHTTMRGPDGEENAGTGCVLEVVEHERLVFSDALGPDYRPAESPFLTTILRLTDEGAGTRYTAIARHATPAARAQHEEMGFREGWGAALDQLVALVKRLESGEATG